MSHIVVLQKKFFLPALIVLTFLFTLHKTTTQNIRKAPFCHPSTKFAILVTSNAPHKELREAQRKAFPSPFLWKEFRASRLFLVAGGQDLIDEKDTLLGDFPESYRHLALKHIMGLSWVTFQCPSDTVIVKMDDDIAVDLPRLLKKAQKSLLSIGGWVHSNMNVRRNFSKWAVTRQEFSEDVYPDFVSGWAYAMTSQSAKIILAKATDDSFWIDDVWITGILRSPSIPLQAWNRFYTPYVEHLECCLADSRHLCDFLALPANGQSRLIEAFGQQSINCYQNSCPKRSEQKYCRVANPLFLPDTLGIGQVLEVK